MLHCYFLITSSVSLLLAIHTIYVLSVLPIAKEKLALYLGTEMKVHIIPHFCVQYIYKIAIGTYKGVGSLAFETTVRMQLPIP